MAIQYSVQRILDILEADSERIGSFDGTIQGIASLLEAGPGDLSFLGNPKYRSQVKDSKASVILVPPDYAGSPADGQLFIKLRQPSWGLALVCRDIELTLLPKPPAGIHPGAIIEKDAEVSPEASIGPFCYVGHKAKVGSAFLEAHVSIGHSAVIGDEACIFSRVVVSPHCRIGRRNRLLPGCVIGADGYGYEFSNGAHQRIPQIGNVITGDDVDVGANSTIDRARFGSTQIGAGTKIDNLVQIGHNVRTGQHCLIVAMVGIGGSTILGDGVVVGGHTGIAGHLKIGTGAMISGAAGVSNDIESQSKVRGNPAIPMMLFNRLTILQRKLPDLFKRFDQLEKM